MRPITHKRLFAGESFALGDLVLVMGEDQVGPAAVDVELVAEGLAGHGRALDVPPGPVAAPRAGPRRLTLFGAFPQGEVARIAFAGLELLARRHELAVQIAVAELAVVRE